MRQLFFLFLILVIAVTASAHDVAQRIDQIIASSPTASYQWSIVVENADGSIRYYERNPDLPLTPASNTKIYTTAAAFEIFGPTHQFRTEVFRNGSFAGSTVTGDINLLVHFDVTWNTSTFTNVRAPLNSIATALRNQGITTVTGNVNVYGVSLYNRGQFDDVRNSSAASLNAETATAFRDALTAAGVTVQGSTSGQTGFSPPGTLIHTYLSGSLTTRWGIPANMTGASYTINRISHNPSAEILLRMIAHHASNGSSILLATGGVAVINLLREIGINTTGMAMNDGSGLSGANRFSAVQTTDLLRYMSGKYPTWDLTLAIGNQSGTISSRYAGVETSGRVRGKTGSLSVCISLSGLIDNRYGEERYYFSFIANDTGLNTTRQNEIRDVIEASIRVLGERRILSSPLMGSVSASDGGLDIRWADPGAQREFLVQSSTDGVTFDAGVKAATEYIIESRGDLQRARNIAEVEFFGSWEPSSEHSRAPSTTPGAGSLFARPTPTRGDRARFTPNIASGDYEVFVTAFNFASANAPGITVRLFDADGTRNTTFNLTQAVAGDRWASVGTMRITHGSGHYVEFDNSTQTNLDNNARMNPAAMRFVPVGQTGPGIRHTPANTGDIRYFRVAGIGRDGAISKFSPVYSARLDRHPNRVLIVDGNDRWARQPVPENAGKLSHDFVNRVAQGTGWRGFDSVDNDLVESGAFNINSYEAVIWMLGEESTADLTFSPAEQTIIRNYLQGGRSLFVSGAEIGWQLQSQGTVADRTFYQEVLKANYRRDSSSTYNVAPLSAEILGAVGPFSFLGGPMDVDFPDEIDGINGGVPILEYTGGTGGNAGIRFHNASYRLVHFGFPFESINTPTGRASVLDRVLNYLMRPEPPTIIDVESSGGSLLVRWTPSRDTNIASYTLQRAESPLGPFAAVTGEITSGATSRLDTDVVAGRTYYYRLLATDSHGLQSAESSVAAGTVSTAPGAPGWYFYLY